MAKVKVISAKEAADMVKDGDFVLLGGFMTCGTPQEIVDEMTAKDLTVVCNDGGFANVGIGTLVRRHQVKTFITSHVGVNRECGDQYNAGEMQLYLQPQGTLIEQVRAGGAGLGGILTPTGIGTIIEDSSSPTTMPGKQVIEVDGKKYILEKPIRGDIAILQGYIADEVGNIRYKGTMRSTNMAMATAADTVIVEVEKIVPAGEIGPDFVETPYIFVDYLVLKEGK